VESELGADFCDINNFQYWPHYQHPLANATECKVSGGEDRLVKCESMSRAV
jgi:hypothetical protein